MFKNKRKQINKLSQKCYAPYYGFPVRNSSLLHLCAKRPALRHTHTHTHTQKQTTTRATQCVHLLNFMDCPHPPPPRGGAGV